MKKKKGLEENNPVNLLADKQLLIIITVVLIVGIWVAIQTVAPYVLGTNTISTPSNYNNYQTVTPTPIQEIEQQTTKVQTSPLIDCIGPDGKHFKTSKKQCDDFNAAWGKPRQATPQPTQYETGARVLVYITDYGGITNGNFYCYADKVNGLTSLENQIKIADAGWSACMSSAQIASSNCSSQCSSASDFNSCDQRCINNLLSGCNSSHVGDLRMQLAQEVSQDCP